MSNKARPKQADRTTLVLLGLMAECPLLFCPLAIWRDRPWAPGWWADAALYAAAAATAVAVLLAVRRPVRASGARWASVLAGGATGLTAAVALTSLLGDAHVSSSGFLLLGGAVALALLCEQSTRTAAALRP
ncbi:hypothetical protein [Kitasatospora sp. NPDC101183]|uniref:hypothetical protein n=1 Tax=Kitasatospora sp. NPDC101183 TaxID=3364100 RepID=UPI0037FA7BA8